MNRRPTLRFALAVMLALGVVGADAGAALASPAARVVTATATKKTPRATGAQIKALAGALSLPKSVIKKCIKGLERSDADQEQSGPTALPPDPAIAIELFTTCPGAAGETLFIMKLAAEPSTGGPAYEYGLGLAIDGQPQSVPRPEAIAGFGRVALSRELFLEPTGEFLALDPAASFARVDSGASALVTDVFAVFRVPDDELGAGLYYLQAFARDGDTGDSPAGFTMVGGELAAG